MLRWIVHQHQMRQPRRNCGQPDEWIVAPHIAVDHQKRFGSQQRQRLKNAAAGFQRFWRLCRPDDLHAPISPVAQHRRQLLSQMAGINNQFGESGRPQGVEVIADQWFAGDRQQWFGGVISQRAHSLTAPGSQNHGFHNAGSQRSTPRAHSNSRNPASSG